MGIVYKGTFTKLLLAGAKIIVHEGHRNSSWLDKADVLAEYLGLELTRRKEK
jgi:hypothetical protein